MAKISKKLISQFKKRKLTKVVNLSEAKSANEEIAEIYANFTKQSKGNKPDISFKIYSLTQNIMALFSEEVSVLKEFDEYYDRIEAIEKEYLPSYPPISPITDSYISYYSLCDYKFGREKETIGTIFYDISRVFSFDKTMVKAIEHLNKSSMRFYEHLGFDEDLILLKDLLTGEPFSCICPSNYQGEKGEIWYFRMSPNLEKINDYHIGLTTPYIIKDYTKQDWIDFFKRQGISADKPDFEKKYLQFMKHHPDPSYWHNYIVDGYLNFTQNSILLTGIPDIKGSKPHEIDESLSYLPQNRSL